MVKSKIQKNKNFVYHSIFTKRKLSAGLTLVEIIVSLGLFIIVATIAVGSLLSIMEASRKAKTIRIGMDNLNIAMERMVRELRTGVNYDCNPGVGITDCVNGDISIGFISQDAENIIYKENSGTIERSNDGGTNFNSILAPDINISNLKFYVNGSNSYASGDRIQAYVVISIEGSITDAGTNSTFRIQTMATQRSPE